MGDHRILCGAWRAGDTIASATHVGVAAMIHRDATDAVFSAVIRESCDWVCQATGQVFAERKGRDAHCSHFISRSVRAVRWYPDNCVLLCAAAHKRFAEHPHEHVAFMRRYLGDVRFRELIARSSREYRYTRRDKLEMRRHYARELERILALRADGVRGPIAVVPFD